MFLFLFGEDSYRTKEKLETIIDYYKKKHQTVLNLKYIDLEDEICNYEDFKKGVFLKSIFKIRKLIIVSHPFKSEDFKNKFLKEKQEFLKNQANNLNTIVFYQPGKVDKKDILFKFLKKNSKCQEFKPLQGLVLRNWVRKKFEKYKTEYDFLVIEQLISYVGNDLWRLSKEIKKLVCFKKLKKVELKDVDLLVKPKIETDIFKTIDALSCNKKSLALSLVENHLKKGDNPLYILSMITFQFRNLLIIKSMSKNTYLDFYQIDSLSQKLKIHPYIIKKSIIPLRNFSLEKLKKIYQKIFNVEFSIKSGKEDSLNALRMLILSI